MRVTVTSNNNIGKVTFGKVTKVANLVLDDLLDVIAQNPVEDQILTYQANLNSYIVKTHPITLLVDGGNF